MSKETEIFEVYRDRGIVIGGELLLDLSAAKNFLEDCRKLGLLILGMDFFIQKGTDIIPMVGNSVDLSSLASEPNAVQRSHQLIERFFQTESFEKIDLMLFVVEELE